MPLVLDTSVMPDARLVAESQVVLRSGQELDRSLASNSGRRMETDHPAKSLRWLRILRDGLGHEPFLLEATENGQGSGYLPLCLVKSALFGRFLVSLPYVNTSGPQAVSPAAERQLMDRAVQLADELDVRYLELRQEREVAHPALTQKRTDKVLMRLALKGSTDELWKGFRSKLRSQIRAGEKHVFDVVWGGQDRLDEFYAVFSRNMRDLGTPVFPSRLFAAVLEQFGEAAELCVVRLNRRAVAAAVLLHGRGTTEVPSASSLRAFNSTGANMVMYWHLLRRAVERGQQVFDFGRSTIDGNTYRFKKQWGAEPSPSVWQYYVRRGSAGQMRPDSGRFGLAVRAWQKLPLFAANLLGPMIIRGIP